MTIRPLALQLVKDGPAVSFADNSARILVRPEPGVFVRPGQSVEVTFKATFTDAKFHNGQQDQVELLLGTPAVTILPFETPPVSPVAAAASETPPAPPEAA